MKNEWFEFSKKTQYSVINRIHQITTLKKSYNNQASPRFTREIASNPPVKTTSERKFKHLT